MSQHSNDQVAESLSNSATPAFNVTPNNETVPVPRSLSAPPRVGNRIPVSTTYFRLPSPALSDSPGIVSSPVIGSPDSDDDLYSVFDRIVQRNHDRFDDLYNRPSPNLSVSTSSSPFEGVDRTLQSPSTTSPFTYDGVTFFPDGSHVFAPITTDSTNFENTHFTNVFNQLEEEIMEGFIAGSTANASNFLNLIEHRDWNALFTGYYHFNYDECRYILEIFDEYMLEYPDIHYQLTLLVGGYAPFYTNDCLPEVFANARDDFLEIESSMFSEIFVPQGTKFPGPREAFFGPQGYMHHESLHEGFDPSPEYTPQYEDPLPTYIDTFIDIYEDQILESVDFIINPFWVEFGPQSGISPPPPNVIKEIVCEVRKRKEEARKRALEKRLLTYLMNVPLPSETPIVPILRSIPSSSQYLNVVSVPQNPKSCLLDKMDEFGPQGIFDALGSACLNHKVDASVLEVLNRFASSFEKMPSMDQIDSVVKDATVNIKFDVKDIAMQVTLYFAILISGFNCAFNFNKKWLTLFTFASMILIWQQSDTVKSFITQHYDAFTKSISSFGPQGISETSLPLLIKFILMVLIGKSGRHQFFGLSKFPFHVNCENFVVSISKLARSYDGLLSVANWAQEIIGKCVNFVRTEILGLSVIPWTNTLVPEVSEWCKQVVDTINAAYSGELKVNISSSNRVQALILEGNKFSTKYFNNKQFADVRDAISLHLVMLRKLSSTYSQANVHGAGARTEPVIVLLRGKSGVGKSFATQPLAIDVMRRVLPPEDLTEMKKNMANYFYSRCSEHQFWDGYAQQPCTMFDDFGQAATMPGNPDDEYMNLIRCAGLFQMVLHMANIEDKGRVVFNSKLIICTTNSFHFCPPSIIDIEALNRRFDFVVDVIPKVEYCHEGFTADHLTRRLNRDHPGLKDGFTTDIYEFKQFHFAHGSGNGHYGAVHDWDTFVSKIVDRYQLNAGSGDRYQSFLKQMVNEFAPQSGLDPILNEAQMQTINEINDAYEPIEDFVEAPEVQHSIGHYDSLDALFADNEFVNTVKYKVYNFSAERNRSIVSIFTDELLEADQILNAVCDLNPKLFIEVLSKGEITLLKYLTVVSKSPDAYFVLKTARKSCYLIKDSDKSFLTKAYEGIVHYFSYLVTALKDYVCKFPEFYKICSFVGGSLTMLMIAHAISSLLSWIFDNGFGDRAENQAHFPQQTLTDTKQSIIDKQNTFPGHTFVYEPEGVSGEQNRSSKKTGKAARRAARPGRNDMSFRPEGCNDQNSVEIVNRLIDKSMYVIRFPHVDAKAGSITILSGRIAILPYHYVTDSEDWVERGVLTPDSLIQLKNNYAGKNATMEFPLSCLLAAKQNECLEELDLCVFELPKYIHQHPNISKYFITHELLSKKLDLNMRLVVPNENTVFGMITVGTKRQNVHITLDGADWYIRQCITYSAHTTKGDCGALVTLIDPSLGAGRIAGIHTAGAPNGMGLASVTSYEDICDAISLFEVQLHPSEEVTYGPQSSLNPAPGDFVPLVTLPKSLFTPPTALRKSELYEAWGPAKTAPALLRPTKIDGVWKDPKEIAIARYGNCPRIVDEDLARVCVQHVFSTFNTFSNFGIRHAPKIFDFDTAVLGIPGNKFCNSIPRDTSSGYPHVLNPKAGYPGKTWYFGKGEEYDLTRGPCIELRVKVDETIRLARIRKRALHVFVDNLKDERRALKKVAACKTRLVSACPLPLLIATRMYFLDFSMFLMENPIYTGSAIGMNAYSNQWDLLGKYLSEKGPAVIAGDYSGFDTSETMVILDLIGREIDRWYGDSESNVRETLFAEVYNSIHLSGNTMYQWLSCLPSGHPLTTIINTIYNLTVMRMAWCYLHPLGVQGLSLFNDNVNVIAYGDDNALNITQDSLPFFNQNTISAALQRIGLTYTCEAKEGDVADFRKISEISFLKRSFRFERRQNRFIAPLELETILEIPYWYHQGVTNRDTVVQNVETTLRELSLHSKEIYDAWSKSIIEASNKILGHFPQIIDYNLLQDIQLSRDEFY